MSQKNEHAGFASSNEAGMVHKKVWRLKILSMWVWMGRLDRARCGKKFSKRKAEPR